MDLLAHQWSGYGQRHGDRKNLLIHAFTVPVFMLGTLSVAAAPATLASGASWAAASTLALSGVVGMVAAIGLQGAGHRRERVAPEPFAGPGDVIVRLLAEQWITFPRYLLSGALRRALDADGPGRGTTRFEGRASEKTR